MRWELPRQVKKERDRLRLTRPDLARVAQAMHDYKTGKAVPGKDVKPLRDGVLELLVSTGGLAIRLYFARIEEDAIILGLHIQSKKKDNDRRAVDLAASRLKKYHRGEWG